MLKGLHEDENPLHLEQGELVRAENVERRGETVGTRSGTVLDDEDYDVQLDEGNDIQGIFERRVNFDAGRQLLVVAQHAASGDDVWTDATTRIASASNATISDSTTVQGNTWTFTEHNNNVFAAGGLRGASGASAGNDDMWWYDGTTITAFSSTGTPILNGAADGTRGLRPTHVFSWRGYLLINGLRGGTLAGDNPACSRYHDFGTDPTNPANWSAGNTLGFSATRPGVDAFGPTYTTGFGAYTDANGQWLLVLTNKALFAYLLDIAEDFVFHDSISNGCVHQNAFVTLGVDSGDAVYASSYGIHSLRQSQQFSGRSNSFLSWKIRKTWATVNQSRLQTIVGAYDSINGRVIFAVPTGSSTVPDKLLVLDVKDQRELSAENARWYVWQMRGFNITSLFYGRTTANAQRLYFGTDDGRVGYFSSETLTDLGSVGGSAENFPCVVQTRHDTEGILQMEKQMGDTYVVVTAGTTGDYNVNYRTIFDFGRSTAAYRNIRLSGGALLTLPATLPVTLAGSPIPRPSRVYTVGSGQTISHEINASSSNPFYVSSIDYNVMVAGEGLVDEAA
jgi:hypothetical protein